MYHGITDETGAAVHEYFRTSTSPGAFERQMDWLQQSGYRGMSLSDAVGQWSNPSTAAAPKPVAITFDDGLKDMYASAYPILRRHGFGATVFVSTAFIGSDFVTGKPCLDAREIRQMSDAGIEFGSHTVSHPNLAGLSSSRIREELETSKGDIEQITGKSVAAFSYPYRFPEHDKAFVLSLRSMLGQAGYRVGVTTAIGRASPGDESLLLKRLPVNDSDDEKLFAAKVEGAYDWLHAGQYAYKAVRALRSRLA
jgi:peptidoglycan/xylan/chitin deacetylase (PgdA/CDA1 family)